MEGALKFEQDAVSAGDEGVVFDRFTDGVSVQTSDIAVVKLHDVKRGLVAASVAGAGAVSGAAVVAGRSMVVAVMGGSLLSFDACGGGRRLATKVTAGCPLGSACWPRSPAKPDWVCARRCGHPPALAQPQSA